jgi:general secretion pathway protein D
LVGRLFRSTNTQVTKKNLMVFIHPRILATHADAQVISSRRYGELRTRQGLINERSDRIFVPSPPPLLPGLGADIDPADDDPALAPLSATEEPVAE